MRNRICRDNGTFAINKKSDHGSKLSYSWIVASARKRFSLKKATVARRGANLDPRLCGLQLPKGKQHAQAHRQTINFLKREEAHRGGIRRHAGLIIVCASRHHSLDQRQHTSAVSNSIAAPQLIWRLTPIGDAASVARLFRDAGSVATLSRRPSGARFSYYGNYYLLEFCVPFSFLRPGRGQPSRPALAT